MNDGQPWTCPFCNRDTIIREEDIHNNETQVTIENADGYRQINASFIVCQNPKCNKLTLDLALYEIEMRKFGGWEITQGLKNWRLIPPSNAKVYPDYIPKPLREDYTEACIIVDDSPKASATLSRRCLQGMIRNFWEVKGNTLGKEIEKIKDMIDPLTWKAIDSVRKIGNIGAHMEKDINLIVDVTPKEASSLIGLIEYLFKDWYIAQEERKNNLTKITEIAQKMDEIKKGNSEESEQPND